MDITYSFMIPVLEAIAKACHSYGWAIVFLTLLVRILVYPLVSKSTKSMQRMSQLQPKLKYLQDRYKDDPELFQKKVMEFYQKNQVNPMGGCLPTLVQLPILFALFATFTGPPFGDKDIPVKVKVVAKSDAQAIASQALPETSSANSAYVAQDGALAKVVVFPGERSVVEGSSLDFGTRAIDGTLPPDFKVRWHFVGDAHGATIDENGHATFPQTGEVTVAASVPGIAKNESFGPIKSLGKVAKGMDLLKPDNWDNLVMIVLFGVTMFLSQKLMVQPPAPNADPEQLLIQKQTQQTMPLAVTAMFFFIPLPSGVFLYMIISNVVQSLQTWMIMRSPSAVLDVGDDLGDNNGSSEKAADKGAKKNANNKNGSKGEVIDVEVISDEESSDSASDSSSPSGKKKKSKGK